MDLESIDDIKVLAAALEHLPTAAAIEDWSALKSDIDCLRDAGIPDIAGHYAAHLDRLQAMLDRIVTLYANRQELRAYGTATLEDYRRLTPMGTMLASLDRLAEWPERIARLASDGRTMDRWGADRTLDGRPIHLRAKFCVVAEAQETWARVLATREDRADQADIERQLATTERRLRQAQALARAGDYTWDRLARRTILRAPVLTEIYGFGNDAVATAEDYVRMVHADDRDKVASAWLADDAGGRPLDIEFRLVRSDGAVRHLRDRYDPVLEEDGTTSIGVGVVQDITDAREATLALAASEQLLRLSQEAAGIGSWSLTYGTGASGNMLPVWSDETFRIFGFDRGREAASSEAYRSIIHPEDRGRVLQALDALAEHGRPYHEVYRIVRRDGDERIVEDRAEAKQDARGHTVGCFGVIRDITQAHISQQRLAERERRYWEIFNESPAPIWIEDWSALKRLFDRESAEGRATAARCFEDGAAFTEALRDALVLDVSQRALAIFGIWDVAEAQAIANCGGAGESARNAMLAVARAFASGRTTAEVEYDAVKPDGTNLRIRERVILARHARHTWSRVLSSMEDVTEERQVQSRLALREAQLSSLFDYTPFELVFVDTDHRLLLVNQEFRRRYDLGDSKVAGLTMTDIAPARAHERIRALSQRALMERTAVHGFDSFERDGRSRDTQETHFPVKDAAGQLIGVGSVSIDITEQLALERALQESEARLVAVVENAPFSIFLKDTGGNYELTNRAFHHWSARASATTRYPRVTYHGLSPLEIYGSRHVRRIDGINARVAAGETVVDTVEHHDPDGRLFIERTTHFPIWAAGGSLRGIGGIAEDVTELTLAARAQAEVQSLLEQASAVASFAYWVIDPESRSYVACSEAYAEIFGMTVAEILALDPSETDLTGHMEPADVLPVKQAFGDLLDHGTPGDLEYRVIQADGARLTIREIARPLRNDQGRVVRIMGVSQDITQLRQLQEQVQQTHRMEAIGQLTAGIAHEFNNLLTAVQTGLGLASHHIGDDHEIAKFLGLSRRAVGRGVMLTRRLLTFSANRDLSFSAVDVNRAISDACALFEPILERNVTLRLELAADIFPVTSSAGDLQEAVINLLINARDAMTEGGTIVVASRATVRERRRSTDPEASHGMTFACIEVIDSGHGMSEPVRRRAMEPFFSTKPPGVGTGLGLSMVYGFANQCGGLVEIDSGTSQGTTVRILLPRHIEVVAALDG